jgi:hypothetical protein
VKKEEGRRQEVRRQKEEVRNELTLVNVSGLKPRD